MGTVAIESLRFTQASHRQCQIAQSHYEAMLETYGRELGVRVSRKHIGWYLETSGRPEKSVRAWRRRLCTEAAAKAVLAGLSDFYDEAAASANGEREAA